MAGHLLRGFRRTTRAPHHRYCHRRLASRILVVVAPTGGKGREGIASTLTITRTPTLSARDAERALRTALSRGGDFAELFWERHETLQLVPDDGRIEDAITGVDQGAGIRVVSGDRTTYANGNVTDADDVLSLAGRAAASVSDGGDLHDAPRLAPDELPKPHSVAIDPRSVPVERKVALLRKANEVARAVDTRVSQATVSYGESVQDIVVSNTDGTHRTDTRVRLNFMINVVAKQGDVLESGFEAVRGTRGFEMLDEDVVSECATIA